MPIIFTIVLSAVFFWLFILSIAIQCGYALYFFTRIFNFPKSPIPDTLIAPPVTVIICAKNEARNLEQHLPAILAQRYTNAAGKPAFEVLVVNDASDDDTEQVLQTLERRYAHLWHTTIGKEDVRLFKGKKYALHIAAKSATYPWVLLTDADCVPRSEDWISHMVQPLSHGKEIVAGFGALRHRPGLLNAFIRWETMHTFVQYSSYALAGKPYMAVGRNLACTKEVLLRAQQSTVWNETLSGDDDLLLQCCATATNTAIVAHRDAFTVSDAKKSVGEWLSQKQRHVSTGKYYKPEVRLLLGVYAVSHALCWGLFLLLLFWESWMLAVFIMAMRCATYWTIWHSTAWKLQERRLLAWMPVCDLGWMVYNFVLGPFIFWKNKQQWK